MTALHPLSDAAGPACGLSLAPRMRYWKPALDLAPFVSGYHLYAVATPEGQPHRDVFQPAWANLRVLLTEGSDWRIRIRDGEWIAPGHVTVFGPTSAIAWSESETGLMVGAGILPRGWVRLFADEARDWANRVDECPPIYGISSENLHAQLCGVHDDEEIPRIFDALLRQAMAPVSRDDTAIARMERALVDSAIGSVGALSAATGLSIRALERLARRAFGFSPKLLLRRARFLRSLHAIRGLPPADRAAAIDPAYTDYSHFVRDSQSFIGMSPKAFLSLHNPLLVQSLALRNSVLGAPAQALAGARDEGDGAESGLDD
jgi:AraC-like DNA-binding protein